MISGTAGVGKTTLAVHWAHQVAERFPDGQLYVDLRGFAPSEPPLAPSEALRGFLEALRVPRRQVPASPSAQAALYRSLVADTRTLVVLDNARDAGQVAPLLPGAPGRLAVVTSRNQLPGLVTGADAHVLALDLLDAEEAQRLLATRLGAGRARPPLPRSPSWRSGAWDCRWRWQSWRRERSCTRDTSWPRSLRSCPTLGWMGLTRAMRRATRGRVLVVVPVAVRVRGAGVSLAGAASWA